MAEQKIEKLEVLKELQSAQCGQTNNYDENSWPKTKEAQDTSDYEQIENLWEKQDLSKQIQIALNDLSEFDNASAQTLKEIDHKKTKFDEKFGQSTIYENIKILKPAQKIVRNHQSTSQFPYHMKLQDA